MWHWTDYCEIYESDVKKKEIQEVTKWMEKDYTGQKKTEWYAVCVAELQIILILIRHW